MGELSVTMNAKTPTLEELSARKAIKTLSVAENPNRQLTDMEPVHHKLVMKHLLAERASFIEKAKDHDWLKSVLPISDVELVPDRAQLRYYEEDKHPGEDRYSVQGAFSQKWQYTTDKFCSILDRPSPDYVRVSACSVVSTSPHKEITIRDRHDSGKDSVFHFRMGIAWRISSQLLLYRLIVIFGMPPPLENDGYECLWEVRLLSSDKRSMLRFCDYKGGSDVLYHGTKEGSESALELINS